MVAWLDQDWSGWTSVAESEASARVAHVTFTLDGAARPALRSHTMQAVAPAPPPATPLRRRIDWLRLAPIVVLTLFVLAAIFARHLAPYDPLAQLKGGLDADGMPLPPGPAHWLGTDDLGRDVLSRLLYGARVSLAVGFFATLLAGFLGISVGLAAGFLGGWVDLVLMRFTEIVMAFPALLLAIGLAAVLPPSPAMVVLTLGLVGWTTLARIVRGQAIALREREFVEAARAVGAGKLALMTRHILPNLAGPAVTLLTLKIGDMLLLEAALSFLGIGIRPPLPSWCNMILDGRDYFRSAPWLMAAPGLAIFIVVVACNLLGERAGASGAAI